MGKILSIYFMAVVFFLIISGFITIYVKIKRPLRFMLVIIFIMLLPLLSIYIYTTKIGVLAETTAPKLIGLTVSQAEPVLKVLDLKLKVVQKTFEKNIPEDQIISQRPEAGRTVKVGRTIDVIVSIGKRRVYVPNLVGKDVSQVEVVLREAGLDLGELRRVASIEFPTDTVMSQYPTSGEEVLVGTRVSLTVCINPEEPTLEALSEDELSQEAISHEEE